MAIEVDFVTLGEASARLDTPAPTLRSWTDQLEDFGVHFVERNNRNERMYYDSDLKIFEFVKKQKAEFGRKTTTKDIAYMLDEKAKEGVFELRKTVVVPERTATAEMILSNEDLKQLMQSKRVQEFMEVTFNSKFEDFKNELINGINNEMEALRKAVNDEREHNKKILVQNELLIKENAKIKEISYELKQDLERIEESGSKIIEQSNSFIENSNKITSNLEDRIGELEKASSKGFFARLFGK